ncbi:LacI family DNA-binding transcriptional regulator [Lacticaseibacillus baoqingensis]|uniref:LacI family DNA-binding transcriptional regulator n=1 Tax=Lacticaseibacillus baoqingensis TaxID=2486013 RepID=A0ABW4E990_9LACO|nr:LacI family DNA-binding transcriptional regulator [Lacticaseibacillus baoqingensis]
MTNIHDIARISGYSVATVSRVINHRPYVSEPVRQAVLKVVRQLDYVPNAVARDLSAGRTMSIGVVTPMREHPYFTELTHALTQAAFARGYHVVLLPSQYDASLEKRYLEQLRRQAYDGLIFTSHTMALAQMVPYQKYGPVVICHDPGAVDLPAAYSDRGETYLEGYRWLKAHGAKQVGTFLPRAPKRSATAAAMVAAYQTVFGRAPAPELLVEDVMAPASGYAAAAKLAAVGVDGIFTNGDDIAANAWRYYQDHQLPEPLLVGQEAQLSGRLLKLPTIDHHFQQVGKLAIALATGELTGQHAVASTFMAP